MKRLLAIGFIWLGCALAWMILGSTIMVRGGESSSALNEEVRLLWGPPIVQQPPTAHLDAPAAPALHEPLPTDSSDAHDAYDAPDAREATQVGEVPNAPIAEAAKPIALDASTIDVVLDLEQRQKGLLWFPTYAIEFSASYAFVNDREAGGDVTMRFPLVGESVVYDAFKVVDEENGEPVDASITDGAAVWKRRFASGERHAYSVVYRSRGTESWGYGAAHGTAKIKNFALRMRINADGIDFPAGTISPSSHGPDADGWKGEWVFDSLVASAPIGVSLPKLLNPGPLATKVTFFAPVSLLFFFFVVAILAAAKRKSIHPMNYFLLGCSFFAFHLLFAYLVDHVSVLPAFAISAVVSVALVASYARLFVGWRFALLDVGVSQLVYLVLFSYTFFWQGFTGLAVTIGAVLTLFVIMQITGRMNWSDAAVLLRRNDKPKKPDDEARPPNTPSTLAGTPFESA